MRYIDKRCPCNRCFIQASCTDYCKWFHSYRALVIAEAEFFTMNCDPSYKFRTENGQRFMSLIEQDASIAYNRIENPKKSITDNLRTVLRNLGFLSARFDSIITNSQKANRGVVTRETIC